MVTIAAVPRVRSDIETGMLLMAAAMLVVPGIDAIAKLLTETLAPGQVAWARFLFQSLLLGPILLHTGGWRDRRHLGLHAIRGALLASATLFFFSALQRMPLADTISIFFVEPLILTLISALFLGEPIGWRRVTAIVVGFAGALLIIGPSWDVFGGHAVLPLGAAICFASYLALTRHVAREADATTMQFWAGLSGLAIMSIALTAGGVQGWAVLAPSWPDPVEWLLLAGVGVIATGAHQLVVMACRYTPAGILAPFQYVEIISATVLGLLIFGDFPTVSTWIGLAIIIGSGLYVFHRERRLARM